MSKLFLDSANLQEIEECLQLGFISGITTNPSLMSKEPKGNFIEHIRSILSMCQKHNQSKFKANDIPVSVEVFAKHPTDMIAQAIEFHEKLQDNNVVIKIPIGWEELGVISTLTKNGIDVNVTCCFTEAQCILAVNAGARYVSIFAGRLIDVNGDPQQTIHHVRSIFDFSSKLMNVEIIVGSVRTTHEITQYHFSGAHIVTASYKLLKGMAFHPQTDKSVEEFLNDFKGWMEPEVGIKL